MKRISYFDVAWNRRDQRGALRLTFDDRSQADLRHLTTAELDMLCSMLRAEKAVYFDESAEALTTDKAYAA